MHSAFALSELGAKGFARGREGSHLCFIGLIWLLCRGHKAEWKGRNQDTREETVAVILTRNEGDLSRLVALFQLPLLQNKLPPKCLKQLLLCDTYEFRAGDGDSLSLRSGILSLNWEDSEINRN